MTHRAAPAWTAALVAAAAVLAPALGGCSTPLKRHAFSHAQMGTRFQIVLYAPDETTATAAANAAFDRIDQLNDKLSDYDLDSELSRLSASAGSGRRVQVSEDLWHVLAASERFWRLSGGAFDVTVGPLVRLWRRSRLSHRLPPPDRLADARRRTGFQHVRLAPESRTVTLAVEGMRLDLGGIAKGYAADEALKVLHRFGVRRALVDAGGDVTLGDPPPGPLPGAGGWRVALRPMVGPEDAAAASVHLIAANLAVATSGDAFRHVVIDGVRYSHIVDPATGMGLTPPIGVTVIAPDGTTADALASAVSVLGPEKGLRLIDGLEGAAARIVVQGPDGRVRTHESARWNEYEMTTEADDAPERQAKPAEQGS